MIVVKVILWILLGVFVLLLTVLGYAILAPIYYELALVWDGQKEASFCFYDLIRVIKGTVRYEFEKGVYISVRVLGFIKLYESSPEEEEPPGEPEEESEDKSEEKPEENSEVEEEAPAAYDMRNRQMPIDKFEVPKSPYEVNYRDNKVIPEDDIPEKKAVVKKEEAPPRDEDNGQDDIPEKADAEVIPPDETISEASGDESPDKEEKKKNKKEPSKLQKIIALLSEENVRAVRYILSCLLEFIKKLLPHIEKIDGTYSIGAPDLTGQFFGILAMMPVLYKEGNYIEADYLSEYAYFHGELAAKGKVKVLWLLSAVIKILINKESRQLVLKILGR